MIAALAAALLAAALLGPLPPPPPAASGASGSIDPAAQTRAGGYTKGDGSWVI
jgi:hypothetical protein